jgi:DNA-binding beta-propeller fold protein YncE
MNVPKTFCLQPRSVISAHRCAKMAAIGIACFMQLPGFRADAKTFAYVTLPDIGKVAILDTATNAVTNMLVLGSPQAIGASRNGNSVYVPERDLLFVIDPVKQAVVAVVNDGGGSEIAFSPDGSLFYLRSGDIITVGDAVANSIIDGVFLQNGGAADWTSMAVGRDGTVYVIAPNRDPGTWTLLPTSVLAMMDPVTRSVTTVTLPAYNPRFMALSPSADFGYLFDNGNIDVLDTKTLSITKTISGTQGDSVIAHFSQGAFSADGTRAYVSAGLSSVDGNVITGLGSTLIVLDTAQQQQVATIPLPPLPGSASAVAVAPDDRHVYVVMSGTPPLVAIDTATNQIVATALEDSGSSSGESQIAFISVPDTALEPSTAQCAAIMCTGDGNGDGTVTIDEIMTAVNNALDGCTTRQ